MNRPLIAWLGLGAAAVMAAAAAPTAPEAPASRPGGGTLTFLVTSDAHYDIFENEDRNERVRETLGAMNSVTNAAWPEELGGGTVGTPRGVLVLGDCIDDGDRLLDGRAQTGPQYRLFEADFGLLGTDGLLKYPVFETWGNHDGPPVGKEKFGFSFQEQLKRRNGVRKEKGLAANVSSNGLHYSWDWEGAHFVMTGIYPADRQDPAMKRYSPVWHDPQGALTFLKEDLEKMVGQSGRPVVVMSHCGFDTDWWTLGDWRAAYEAMRPYNVVLYLYGHSGTGLRTWAPAGEDRVVQCVNTGQTEKGFFAVEMAGDKVRLAYRIKNGKTVKGADGKSRFEWDGTWDWKFPFQHTLRPLGMQGTDPGEGRQAAGRRPDRATRRAAPAGRNERLHFLFRPPG